MHKTFTNNLILRIYFLLRRKKENKLKKTLETGHGPDLAQVSLAQGLGQPTTGQRRVSARANGQLDRILREPLISGSTLQGRHLPACACDVFDTQKKNGDGVLLT